jgi:hypothetical protein
MNAAPSVIVSKESALAYECISPLVKFFYKKTSGRPIFKNRDSILLLLIYSNVGPTISI